MNSPILICGAPGSGTSLVTRMLRHAGLFVGADAGPLNSRKFHESKCFRDYNRRFLDATIGFEHAPKGVGQFERHVEVCQKRVDELHGMVDTPSLLSTFLGDEKNGITSWGWKDPRNSATALIWRHLFPDLRLLIVQRTWRTKLRNEGWNSPSGQWYRMESTKKIRELYLDPPGTSDLDSHRVDFDRLISHRDEIDSALRWANLDSDQVDDFDAFLQLCGVE